MEYMYFDIFLLREVEVINYFNHRFTTLRLETYFYISICYGNVIQFTRNGYLFLILSPHAIKISD